MSDQESLAGLAGRPTKTRFYSNFSFEDNVILVPDDPRTAVALERQGQSQTWNRRAAHALAGAISGGFSALVSFPLDVTKVKLQAQIGNDPIKYSGTYGTLRTIYMEEGFKGWYRGLSANLLGVMPSMGLYFTLYESFKSLGGEVGSTLVHVISAPLAYIITVTASNPIWVVKTRLQTQNYAKPQYSGTADAFRKIVASEGVRGLYKGLGPSCLGSVFVLVQLPTYEKLKRIMAGTDISPENSLAPQQVMAASAASMVAGVTFAYPTEVVRTRLQIQGPHTSFYYNGISDAFRSMYKTEGFRGFYKGMGTNLVRLVPSGAVTFTTFEMCLRLMNRYFFADNPIER